MPLRLVTWTTLALLFLPALAGAQPVRSRLLVGLDTRQRDGEWEATVQFSVPVRYLRHAPLGRARAVHIQLSILRSDLTLSERAERESLRVRRDSSGPLVSADLEPFGIGRALLNLRFDSAQTFEVWQGEDFRSLRIRFSDRAIGEPPREDRRESRQDAEESPMPTARDAELLGEARKALTAGEHQRAILILREIRSLPEGDSTRDAMELLGLAHERSDQNAHAVAEYREFLAQYPDGPQAQRVRQRLQALLTRADRPKTSTPSVRIEEPPLDWDMLGSFYVGYRRESRLLGGDEIPLDDSLFADLHSRTRVRTDRWNFRGEISGGYRYSLLDSSDSDERISRLFARIEDEVTGLSATFGRQTRSSGGVLGRFDGLLASYEPFEGISLSVVGGLPVDSSTLEIPDFDQYFFGASLDASRLFGWLDAQLFAIDQRSSGYEDRRAVGGELRFVAAGRFASAYVDYDLLFDSLNIAQLTANWNVTSDTFVNLLVDYRNSPILTLTGGLVSQPETELGQLAERLSMDEIRKLAEDRTARSTMISIGASHRITDRAQLSGDFTMSRFSEIEEFDGFGSDDFEYSYHAQVLATNLLRSGDAATGSLRFFDGNTFRAVTASFDLRWPMLRALRLNPRFRVETRWGSEATRLTTLRPSIRADLRVWKLMFDLDSGVEWRTPKRDDGSWGYYLTLGARYDF